MATQKVADPGRLPPPFRGLRIALDILIGLLLLIAALCGVAYWYMRSAQPALDGRVALAGLRAPVTMVRDSRGIPHITAGNLHDLYLAQGFAMAQDRLWQMDLLRRLGEGRLAAVFGPAALPLDERTRRLGLNRAINAEAAHLPPKEAAVLGAFAQGVNDDIARRSFRLPLEFWLLRYRPRQWRPKDTLALAAYMFRDLASDYKKTLERESFTAVLGPALEAEAFPQTSPWDVIPGGPLPPPLQRGMLGPRRGRFGRGYFGRRFPAPPVFPAPAPRPARPRGGSNAWAISGAHSFDGRPILANDPHLQFQVPGLWWAVELATPQFRVAGVAIAGVPGVIVGHNQHIAWGVTNTNAGVQDLYRLPAGAPTESWRETILVRGARPVAFTVPATPQGWPIVAHDAGGRLALVWTLYAPGALQSIQVFLALDQARNWQEFEAALARFPGPAQNFMYADTAGNIGFQVAGWVPLRHGYDGSVPVPADDPRYAWHGWIPFAQLPHVLNPPSGMLATANGRVTPNHAPYTLSTDWDAPNRTRRIYQLLEELPRWNASAMLRVQTDVVSEEDFDFARALLAAGQAESARGVRLDATTRRALGLLRFFSGAMGHGSSAPTLAYMTRKELVRQVLAAKVGVALARDYRWDESPVFAQWLLATKPAQWLPPTYAAPGAGGWDALLIHCLDNVVARTTLNAGDLHWGRYQTLSILHPVYSRIPYLRRFADLGPVEINGSRLTVKQARNVALGARNDLGPSMRFVADLGDWDRSMLTLVAGESGEVFSPHYRDQFEPYLRGFGLPLWFTPQAVAAHARHTLHLLPAAH
jgi:penicillin amidase